MFVYAYLPLIVDTLLRYPAQKPESPAQKPTSAREIRRPLLFESIEAKEVLQIASLALIDTLDGIVEKHKPGQPVAKSVRAAPFQWFRRDVRDLIARRLREFGSDYLVNPENEIISGALGFGADERSDAPPPMDGSTDALENASLLELRNMMKKIINSNLSGRERKIIGLRYGIPGRPGEWPAGVDAEEVLSTERELAAIFGVSRAGIRQIEHKALKKLRRKIRRNSEDWASFVDFTLLER